jgi:hypothetical protein
MLSSLFPVAPSWGWWGFLFCRLSREAHRARVCAAVRSGPGSEMRRVAVFIDWQNAYQQAWAAFGLVGSGYEGQFSPLRLFRPARFPRRSRRSSTDAFMRAEN